MTNGRLTAAGPRWRRRVGVAVVIGLLLALTASTTPSAGVRSDGEWILSAQLPDGAIAATAGGTAVVPYLGNYAAVGLARAAQATGDPVYARAAWRWLGWYQAHPNAMGVVPDYTVGASGEVATGTIDSTDAYAGTFLLAVRAAWLATHERRALQSLAPGIAAAVRAIEVTQDRDGLTWAKPSFHVKYLMDQSEAYAGLRAAARLAQANGTSWLARRAARDAARMKRGVARLWNSNVGAYDWARQANGATTATKWSVFYPDAVTQTWAVAFGLVTGGRAARLMRHFARVHPNWDQPTARDRFDSTTRAVGYWPVVGWAFASVGDGQRSDAASRRIEAASQNRGREWPFTTADAGQLILQAGGEPALSATLAAPGSR